MRYLLPLLLLTGCTTYSDYEKEATREVKVQTENKCDKYQVVMTTDVSDKAVMIKIMACDKCYTTFCMSDGGCNPVRCKIRAVSVDGKIYPFNFKHKPPYK